MTKWYKGVPAFATCSEKNCTLCGGVTTDPNRGKYWLFHRLVKMTPDEVVVMQLDPTRVTRLMPIR